MRLVFTKDVVRAIWPKGFGQLVADDCDVTRQHFRFLVHGRSVGGCLIYRNRARDRFDADVNELQYASRQLKAARESMGAIFL